MFISTGVKVPLIILILIGCSAVAFSQSTQSTPPPTEFQSWNEIDLILPVIRDKDAKGASIDRVTATFTTQLRLGRSGPDLEDQRYGFFLNYRLNKYLSPMTGLFYRRDDIVQGSPHSETRMDFGALFSATLHQFSISDRNLYEHRFRAGRANTDIYRQRFQISHPLKYEGKTIFSPFITNESFIDIHSGSLTSNEFYAGITRIINPRTAIDVAYVRNDTATQDVNGFNINFRYRLR